MCSERRAGRAWVSEMEMGGSGRKNDAVQRWNGEDSGDGDAVWRASVVGWLEPKRRDEVG